MVLDVRWLITQGFIHPHNLLRMSLLFNTRQTISFAFPNSFLHSVDQTLFRVLCPNLVHSASWRLCCAFQTVDMQKKGFRYRYWIDVYDFRMIMQILIFVLYNRDRKKHHERNIKTLSFHIRGSLQYSRWSFGHTPPASSLRLQRSLSSTWVNEYDLDKIHMRFRFTSRNPDQISDKEKNKQKDFSPILYQIYMMCGIGLG